MIPFNKPPFSGREEAYIHQALAGTGLSGDGVFGRKCQAWFEGKLGCAKALLTPSCTHALEMAAILLDLHPGDEVIMPSYTFVSTANAFAMRGVKVVFVDIRPDTMNIDDSLIESAISARTKAIVPVHYAGVGCAMDAIMELAERYGLFVVEDAAQAMMGSYKGRALGTIGHLGAYSFHETKNYTSGGEGGLLVINDKRFAKRAEIVREKGTNRAQFFRGMVDKYTWVDVGSSYLMSELQAAYLWAQLQEADNIHRQRLALWETYYDAFLPLSEQGRVEQPCRTNGHNGHIFWLKLSGLEERSSLIEHLRSCGVIAAFHYVPLHSSTGGRQYGTFVGEDRYTTRESERIVRLPLYLGMKDSEIDQVIRSVLTFFE